MLRPFADKMRRLSKRFVPKRWIHRLPEVSDNASLTTASPTKLTVADQDGAVNLCQPKNLLDTFGYLEIDLPRNVDYLSLSTDYWHLLETYSKCAKDQFIQARTSYVIPGFAFFSKAASRLLVDDLDSTICRLIGPNYILLGSDASLFFGHGSGWHRDYALSLPVFKLNVYLDFNDSGLGGRFLILPGSQHVGDAYSSLLQKSLSWPVEPADRSFFPKWTNPAEVTYNQESEWLPTKSLEITRGSAILFNTNLIHAVSSKISPGTPRRLITYIFCANPVDLSPKHYCRSGKDHSLSNEELLDQIYHLKAVTYLRTRSIGYGEAIDQYGTYISKHGLDFDRVVSRAQLLRDSGYSFPLESGRHSDVPMDKMKDFLTANFKDVDNLSSC
ncbi:MAG: hypothetical protein ACK55E_02650 [Cyanobacteriota bacterium]|jgi:hypothetical protein